MSYPGSAREAILTLNALNREGKFDESIARATEPIKNYPDVYELYANRAVCYLQEEKLEPALADFTMALKVNKNPKSRWALLSQRARCYAALQQRDKAEGDFAEACKTLEGEADPILVDQMWRLRATNLYDDRRYQESVHCYTEALKALPQNPKSVAGRALAYAALHDQRHFKEDLATLEKLDPKTFKLVKEQTGP